MTNSKPVRRRKRRQHVVFDPPLKFKTHSYLPLPGSRLGAALRWFALLVAIAFMASVTYSATRSIERFKVTDVLFQADTFDPDLSEWEVYESPDGVVGVVDGVVGMAQVSAAGNLSLSRDIELTPEDKYLRLTGNVSGEDIVPGENNWEAARVVYLELDESGKYDSRRLQELVSLSGTEPLQTYSTDIVLSDFGRALRISMQMFKTTGVLEVSSLTLHRAELSPQYKTLRFWLISGWSLILLWCLFLLVRSIRSGIGRVFLLSACAVFVIGILSPGSINSRFFAWIEGSAGISQEHAEYAVHFLGFALFGVLLKLFQRRRPFFVLVAVCLIVSLVSEVLQLLTLDRSLQYIDMIINFSGAVLGVLMGFVILKLSRAIVRWRYKRKLDLLTTQQELAEEIELAYQEND